MKLYHGSNIAIDRIDLSYSKRYKDFGRAFYLSDSLSQAQQMAETKCASLDGTPCVSVYEFDERNLSSSELNVKIFDAYSREWAEFIFNNRDESQQFVHPYDIVYGPIADDYIGLQIRNYKLKNITFAQFLRKIKYHKGISFQYAFCTQRAIDKLQKI